MATRIDPFPGLVAALREDFVAEHGGNYDASTDTYQRDPLVVHGRHGKGSALYNAHPYHTKVPPEAIAPYLEHYTRPGDLVLDPFCGSGMTGVACLLSGRSALLSDLSPAAVHIASNYCRKVDLQALKEAWRGIRSDVADEFKWLYGTTCDRCHGPATIQYTVWSDLFDCPRCHAEIVLWDAAVVREESHGRYEPPLSGLTVSDDWTPYTLTTAPLKGKRAGEEASYKVADVVDEFICPNCKEKLTKTRCRYLRTVPVLTVLECDGVCRPRRQQHPTTSTEHERIADIATQTPPYWIPDTPFEETREMYLRNSRTFRDQGVMQVRDFWTPRNLWAVASLWHRASTQAEERIRSALKFIVTSILLNTARTQRYNFGRRGNGALSGTLYIGSFTAESNVGLQADRKWQDILDGLAEQTAYREGAAYVSQADAANLAGVPDRSVDYVFTDPPFGSNIFYGDCSLLWEAWLGDLTDLDEEAVWNKSRKPEQGGKTLDEYGDIMERSFAEMYRVLKPGRWATVVFSNSDDRVWRSIQDAAEKAGFAMAGAGTLDKMQRSYKGVKGETGEENVVTKDVVMNLLKPVTASARREAGSIDDPEEHVREAIHTYLSGIAGTQGAAAKERTTQSLYDHVVTLLLTDGLSLSGISSAFVQSVAQRWFKQIDGLWYRKGDRVRSDKPRFDVVDETSAVLWLEQRLSEAPATEADLAPDFNTNSVGVRLSGGISRLLQDNFILDRNTKRWRLPTALEREALNDSGTERSRRRILHAVSNPVDDSTSEGLLDLTAEAMRLEMYREAHYLRERVHLPDLSDSDRERATILDSVIKAHLED